MRTVKLSYVAACVAALLTGFAAGSVLIPDRVTREDEFWKRTLTTFVYHEGLASPGQLAEGWSPPDENGTWSAASKSALLVDFDKNPANTGVELEFAFSPLLVGSHNSQTVNVSVNGFPVSKWKLHGRGSRRIKSFYVDGAVWNAGHPKRIEFEYARTRSMAELGLGSSREKRAILLSSLVIRKRH